jgi:DNA-binding response OmpR family regulator
MSDILIVEDEQHIADGIRFNLEAEGHSAVVAGNGEDALDLLLRDQHSFDAVILDVMLPGIDGFSVAAELRAAGQYVPLLMLTARGREEDVLRGFEAGADDYLTKPFELAILLARLRGLLRRHRWNGREALSSGAAPPRQSPADAPADEAYTFAGRTLDFAAMEVRARGESHRLTLMECELLRYLVKKAGVPVSRRAILEDVWGLHEGTDTRAIDNFIVRLRRYIEDKPATPRFLLTVRGVGYRFVPDAASAGTTP